MAVHGRVADVAGSGGFVLLTVWPPLRGRRAILAAPTAGAVAFVLH